MDIQVRADLDEFLRTYDRHLHRSVNLNERIIQDRIDHPDDFLFSKLLDLVLKDMLRKYGQRWYKRMTIVLKRETEKTMGEQFPCSVDEFLDQLQPAGEYAYQVE